MGDEMSKSNRVLDLYQALQNGQVINKKASAEAYGVNEKSIQRDLDSIRDFLSEQTTRQGLIQSVEFDRTANGYRLVTEEMTHISEGEMLAICKILLESRAFDKTELESLVNKVMNHCVSPKKVKSIEPFISNELFNYREPAHRPPSMSVQWQAAQAIQTQNMLENSRAKIAKKNLDMIVANNLKVAGAGFGTDTNVITLIAEDFEKELPLMSKKEAAGCILNTILERM